MWLLKTMTEFSMMKRWNVCAREDKWLEKRKWCRWWWGWGIRGEPWRAVYPPSKNLPLRNLTCVILFPGRVLLRSTEQFSGIASSNWNSSVAELLIFHFSSTFSLGKYLWSKSKENNEPNQCDAVYERIEYSNRISFGFLGSQLGVHRSDAISPGIHCWRFQSSFLPAKAMLFDWGFGARTAKVGRKKT